MNEINFGMDGLSLDNTRWYNPKTGDNFTVRSNYFEDNQMILQAFDGRRFNLANMNDYVQWNGKGDPPKAPKNTERVKESLPPEIANMLADKDDENPESYLLPEDMNLIKGGQNKQVIPPLSSPVQHESKVSSKGPNYDIIDRALNKTKRPDYHIAIKWPQFPEKEIEMLNSIMDVPMHEIADYYLDRFVREYDETLNDIREQFITSITNKLRKNDPAAEPETKTRKTTRKKADAKS